MTLIFSLKVPQFGEDIRSDSAANEREMVNATLPTGYAADHERCLLGELATHTRRLSMKTGVLGLCMKQRGINPSSRIALRDERERLFVRCW